MDQQFKSYRTFKNYLWKLDKNVLDFFKKGEFKYLHHSPRQTPLEEKLQILQSVETHLRDHGVWNQDHGVWSFDLKHHLSWSQTPLILTLFPYLAILGNS